MFAVRMAWPSAAAGVAAAGLLAAAVAGSAALSERQPPADAAFELQRATASAAAGPSAGERWLDDVLAALGRPTRVELPFARVIDESSGAAAYAFRAAAGQTLELGIARDGAAAPAGAGRVYVEVFRVRDILNHSLHERLAALRSGSTSLRARLPSDGTYLVLVEPEAGESRYRLRLELEAALRFPVLEGEVSEVRSEFGAVRDGGRRHHQGIDIYARRLTPVLAVVSGIVRPAQDRLGGNTVWLNAAGTSYYYAHLDRVAVRENQRVRAGDVLGYVGNTGNARNTPSHLHFAVYRWGKEPVDPLPLLTTRRFAQENLPPGAPAAGG